MGGGVKNGIYIRKMDRIIGIVKKIQTSFWKKKMPYFGENMQKKSYIFRTKNMYIGGYFRL